MYANLNEVKERLEKEGIINDIKYYNNDSELAINEDYFIWNKETGESDLYFIKIIIDKNGRYAMETCFCEGDFLDRYNNQEDYIRKVIDSMNSELDNQIKDHSTDDNTVYTNKKLKTTINTVSNETAVEDMISLFEAVDIQVDECFLRNSMNEKLDESLFIDFIVEDMIKEYLSSLNLENDKDYCFALLDDEFDFAVVSLTILR